MGDPKSQKGPTTYRHPGSVVDSHRLWGVGRGRGVMNRGHNRERILGDDDDRHQFLRLLARY